MEILMSDSYSLVLNIKSDDVYKELEDIKSEFDFSDYKVYHKELFCKERQKIPGYFKDETAGNPITEFYVLKSKSYGYETLHEDEETKNVNKCINIKNKRTKDVLNQESKIDEFKICLLDGIIIKKENTLIDTKMHEIYVVDRDKIAFNAFDDKRFILIILIVCRMNKTLYFNN